MVRLVFRPYTQVWRTICTSVPLRASTRVSPGFTLLRHSSPSFGSYHTCSYSSPFPKIWIGTFYKRRALTKISLSLRLGDLVSQTRMYGRLLGPCFKTGRIPSFDDTMDCIVDNHKEKCCSYWLREKTISTNSNFTETQRTHTFLAVRLTHQTGQDIRERLSLFVIA